MTRKEALTDLLAKVDEGALNRWSTANTPLTSPQKFFIQRAYNGSLDAARALHEAVLPGWDYEIVSRGSRRTAHVYPDPLGRDISSGKSENPARAWLIAVVKALISECDE